MNKLIWSWNLIHYYVFQWQKEIRISVNTINPISQSWKSKYISDPDEKDIMDSLNMYSNPNDLVYLNPKLGRNRVSATVKMGGLLGLFLFGILNIVQSLIIRFLDPGWHVEIMTLFVINVFLTFPLHYYALLKDDRYLSYFKEFDQMTPEKRQQYGWISLSTILLILLFGLYSIRLL